MKISISQAMMVLVAVTGAFAGPAFPQDSQVDAEPEADLQTEAGVESEQMPHITIEEIRVTAERSPFVLRRQLEAATEDFVTDYNELNEIDEFDINCNRSNWTHTRIQGQACMPVFFERALAEAARMAFITGDFIFTDMSSVAFAVRPKFEQLENHILQMALEHPDLTDSLLELGKIQAALKAKKDECMANPGFLGIFRLCR
ncbi:MAG: hypothetical protein F4X09_00820 [Gammaproteobacteria bacterium]|nr:hypothetical protein [Gammaproteobacteria bacterium]MYC58727.1 hypothetical protein [Gammaproteobacteria bacterium]MYH84790.1 hypothetical protein [Gammaproteobacteria bacterium]MYK04507.1 hypothetical protein [Gammaproteobacteria bacterium]